MSVNEIVKDNHNYYSQAGKSSMEKITYLLDRKTKIDKILEGKQRTSIIKDNNISQEENQEVIDIQDEDDNDKNIFSEKYKNKHNLDIQEQKLKYFAGVKNPCTYIEKKVKKNITERRKVLKKEKNEKKENSPKKVKEDLSKTIAQEELYKIISSGNNFNYYYHLLHHTDNANYYSENAKNIIIFGPEVNATRYNPKLEYIYPKTIYSPSFKSMSGRYDKEELTEKLKKKLEKKINVKKTEKLKEKVDKNVKIKYKNRKSQGKIELNKKIMYKKYIDEKTNSSNTFKGNGSELNTINFNELITKEYNNSNSKNNNKSGTNNNNETIFTSNIIKNANYNESNINNSNINNNIILNNAFLTIRLTNYLNALKNNNNKKIRKINIINKSKYPDINLRKTTYASSTSNIFKNDKNKIIKLNRTSSDMNIFSTKTIDSIQNNNRIKLNKEKEYTIRAPNFNKMLSRDYLNKLNYQEEPIHPQLNPNFNVVQPKCVMKVIYSQRPTPKKTINILKGLGDEFTFDINKLYHKYNNHSPAKSFYLNKMTGRANKNKDNNLPSYMSNLANRYSCVNFNEKSYLMNNFYEGRLKSPISSFNQQKSFNYRLINQKNNNNLNEEKNNDKDAFKIFTKIFENISTKNKRKKLIIPQQDYMSVTYRNRFLNGLPEFYRVNLDSIKRNNKIDGITYKMYRNSSEGKDLLSKKDKKVFLVNVNENN